MREEHRGEGDGQNPSPAAAGKGEDQGSAHPEGNERRRAQRQVEEAEGAREQMAQHAQGENGQGPAAHDRG